MSVVAAVSACICVEHLEPVISSCPPNATVVVMMLRLGPAALLSTFLLLGQSRSLMDASPRPPVSALAVKSSHFMQGPTKACATAPE